MGDSPLLQLQRAFAKYGLGPGAELRADQTAADLATGGLLSPTQRKPFVSKMYEATPVLKMASVETMTASKHEISQILIAERLLKKPPAENAEVAAGKRVKATTTKNTLTAHQFRGRLDVSYRVIRQNIEKEGYIETLMGHVAQRCGVDVAITAMQGDTAIVVVDDETEALSVMDGWLVKAKARGQYLDAAGRNIDADLMDDVYDKMPSKFIQNSQMNVKYLAQYRLARNWRRQVQRRATLLGDNQLVDKAISNYSSAPIIATAEMPLTTSGGITYGQAMFCDPANLVVGIHEAINLKLEDWPSTESVRIHVSMEIDAEFVIDEAIVICDNVALL
jgi:hypothetical protein